MPSTIQVGGPVGPLLDPKTNQPVHGKVWGTCAFEVAPGVDPALAQSRIAPQVLSAVTSVYAQKLSEGHISIVQVRNALPHFMPEIVGATGLQGLGVQIVSLDLQIEIDGGGAGAPQPQPPPQQQQRQQDGGPHVNYQLNIGGLRIKGSSDGGVDSKGLQNQLVEKAKSEIFWWILTAGIVLVVLLGLGGLGIYIYMAAKDPGPGGAAAAAGGAGVKDATWDGKSKFSCGGNDSVRLKGITAKLASGVAIEAGGNCDLVLEGVQLTSPIGIQAGANASVTVNGGSIDASDVSVKALGNATVTLKGTKVKGKTQALGGAKITGP